MHQPDQQAEQPRADTANDASQQCQQAHQRQVSFMNRLFHGETGRGQEDAVL